MHRKLQKRQTGGWGIADNRCRVDLQLNLKGTFARDGCFQRNETINPFFDFLYHVACVAMETRRLVPCLDQCVPIEVLAAKVVHKVKQRIQRFFEEIKKWMAAQDADGQHSPLLDANGVRVENFGFLGACEGAKKVRQRKTDSVCVNVGLCVCQHKDVRARLSHICTAAIGLAEIRHIKRKLRILVISLRKPPQNCWNGMGDFVPTVEAISKRSFPSLGFIKYNTSSRTYD